MTRCCGKRAPRPSPGAASSATPMWTSPARTGSDRVSSAGSTMTKPPSCCASSRCAPPDMLRTTARTLNADRVPAPRAARPALRLVGDVDPRSAVSGSGTPARSDPRRAGGSRSAARRAAEPRAAHGTRAHESGRVVGATPQARADRATDGAEAGRRPHPLHAGPGERALHLPDDRHAREFFQRDCLSASDGVLKENCTSGRT
jgi:hypothetical protein